MKRFKIEEDTTYFKLLKCFDEPIEVKLESSLADKTLDDPEFRTPSMEITFVSERPSACGMEEGIVVAQVRRRNQSIFLMTNFAPSLVIYICFLLVNMAAKLKGKLH